MQNLFIASVGIEMALGRSVDIAINHDPEAIRMHRVNHPNAIHLTEDIFTVNLERIVNGRRVALMWASPDCTSHSKAKGSQPRNSGLRILPWAVYKHAKTVLPEVIIMENVEEIQDWGALDENGYPIKNAEALAVRITKNVCVAHYRKSKPADTLDGHDTEGGDPATILTDLSDSTIIRDSLLNGLTDTQRRCLELRNAAGLSLDEIASVTGKPKSSVKTTISTARKQMLEQLKKQL